MARAFVLPWHAPRWVAAAPRALGVQDASEVSASTTQVRSDHRMRRFSFELTTLQIAPGTFAVTVPEQLRGRWCRLSLEYGHGGCLRRWLGWSRDTSSMTVAQIDAVTASDRNATVPLTTLLPRRGDGRCGGLAFLSSDTIELHLRLFSDRAFPRRVKLIVTSLTRAGAAARICLRHSGFLFWTCLGGRLMTPPAAPRGVRAAVAQLAFQERSPPYPLWVRLFDTWNVTCAPDRCDRPEGDWPEGDWPEGDWPKIAILVLCADAA